MKISVVAVIAIVMFGFTNFKVLADSHQKHHCSHNKKANTDLTIERGWARATPGMVKNGAVYLTVLNKGKKKDTLVAAESELAERTEIHTHQDENGIMKMRRVPALEISPKERITFKPGGYHVMLLGLHEPLKRGKTITLKLIFKTAGKVKFQAKIMGVGTLNAPSAQKQNEHKGTHHHH